jgi:large subunit ribosomal protein L4
VKKRSWRKRRVKMNKAVVYSIKQTKTSNMRLPKEFDEKENMLLLAQAIRVYESNKHPSFSKVKTRGEVRASTRKIHRQKGLGLARHGAKSAPIFVGGGVAHGPKGIKRKLSLPKKMRQKALSIALSLKAKDKEVVVVSDIDKIKKTKEAQKLLDKVIKEEKKGKTSRKITVALSKKNRKAKLFFRNIKNVEIYLYENLNPYCVFYGGLLVIDKDALGKIGRVKK